MFLEKAIIEPELLHFQINLRKKVKRKTFCKKSHIKISYSFSKDVLIMKNDTTCALSINLYKVNYITRKIFFVKKKTYN